MPRHAGVSVALALSAALIVTACEDGPAQIFEPNHGNIPQQNGFAPTGSFTQPGDTGWNTVGGAGDSVDRARFCDQTENDAMIQRMVLEPAIPDVSVGGIPLWTATGSPTPVDDLIGRPEDGKFCDPTGVYSNALTWGAYNEIIVFFNADTRLIEDIQINGQYLGTMSGLTTVAGAQTPVLLRMRDRIKINGRELIDYASSADQNAKSNSWLNHKNITQIYGMMRETFLGGDPVAADYNCVADQICDVIYSSADESIPQQTLLVFKDPGVTLIISPEGHLLYQILSPVRLAPFEKKMKLAFGASGGGVIAPKFTSDYLGSCELDLSRTMLWRDFANSCIHADPIEAQRLLGRFGYEVQTQRDAVDVNFNGISLTFLRRGLAQKNVFRDGERPADDDELLSVTLTRSLDGRIAEFSAQSLAVLYKTRLETKLRNAVSSSYTASHPIRNYRVAIPSTLSAQSQRMGELWFTGANGQRASWIAKIQDDIKTITSRLSVNERSALLSNVDEPLFVIEPFVDVVMTAISHGATDDAKSVKAFKTTDNRRWSIGYGDFYQGNEPWRVVVQYSLYFGAITAITVSHGKSDVDAIIDQQRDYLFSVGIPSTIPFYRAEMLTVNSQLGAVNALGLLGTGIEVLRADRELTTVDVRITVPAVNGAQRTSSSTLMTVPGRTIADRGGYNRQIRGQRYEFIPADEVSLFGQETAMTVYVTQDGSIGRVYLSRFKGRVELCPGLSIGFGDDVRNLVEAWSTSVDIADFQSCDIVFNTTENGNVLNDVASLSRRISVIVDGKRASGVAVWK